jgi:hypothetical protein
MSEGDEGTGEVPSPMITAVPVAVFVVAPLTAEIAPASIRLAKAAIIVFFMGFILLAAKSRRCTELAGESLHTNPANGQKILKYQAIGKRREFYSTSTAN